MVDLVGLLQTLTTPHPLDRYLELIRPTLTARDLRAEIVEVRRAAADSVTITLRPTRQWRGHAAGQFVRIGVVIDGVRHTRCYSPVDPEGGERRLRLTVKAHPGGLVSRYLHDHAAPGMVVDLAPAAGVFRLADPRPDRVLLISGGSGITPVLSILKTLAAEDYRGEVTFLHYAKSPESVPHRDEIEAIAKAHTNIRIEFRYTAKGTKHFDYDELERVAPWFADGHAFVCGPPALMAAVRQVYEAEQLAHRLHTEEFTVSAAPAADVEVTGTVHFSASGINAPNSGASLLEQAESSGLTPEFGCRMGICFSCTAIRRTGCTRDVRTGIRDADPDQPIQLCVSAPVGDVTIEI
ncbi:ferredoxin reductase [Nocardia panacis]|uniref:Ferredoxin reductase n=1 Tax=Nocardia panacis TaxID=2340916 RepID=A0A3A4K8D0_9NOCA|nr:ferredoxin reductase [Nocardia panacis]RJO77587.1 ferredoxin reductase [Nocardia panacis]